MDFLRAIRFNCQTMAPPKTNPGSARALEASAMRHEGVDEAIACEGTPLEKRTFRVRKKAFVFLGSNDVMLKLGASLAVARELAAAEPERFKAGSGGWVTVRFTDEQPPPMDLLDEWIGESYAVFAAGAPAKKAATKKAAKKKAAKKETAKNYVARPRRTSGRSR